ncbi:YhzD family protein [Halalkalibacter alkalisediminis]|uniref:YhzD family protein n=1 Tax=Halalkalibacter alkalisediminis TaxID=935616 RepID=A0ABV6NND0_9BACI|nr:YhzD family protein [Halalkalibacter alkalisediminis]
MYEYFLTVFNPSGEIAFEERFEAESDEAAKKKGEALLSEKNYLEHTHRLTRSGKLLLFHR